MDALDERGTVALSNGTILVLNAGSSTLKYGLFDAAAKQELAAGVIEEKDYRLATATVLQSLKNLTEARPIQFVGHRVVHGGEQFRESVRIDDAVVLALQGLEELAPLHIPPALQTIEAARKALPQAQHVATFDTAYFADLPPRQFIYPVPYSWYSQWGIRRFGFHGISYAFSAPRAAEILGRDPHELNLVICHLGNGCSATAVRGGTAAATSMGFTPLEGLMMGTRSGSVDPGILLYVQRRHGSTAAELENLLNHESGLLGVSGISGDHRAVTRAATEGNVRARLALDIYADRIRATIGALAVTLGRLDALVFTAGVGEHSADLRLEVCRGLECLGIFLDPNKNAANEADSDIAASDSKPRVLILHTREELFIAQETLSLAVR